MKRKRFPDEQIAYALRQARGDAPVEETCQLGISTAYKCQHNLSTLIVIHNPDASSPWMKSNWTVRAFPHCELPASHHASA